MLRMVFTRKPNMTILKLLILYVDDVGISIAPDQDVRWPVKVEKPLIVYEKDVEIQRYLENIYKGKKFEVCIL